MTRRQKELFPELPNKKKYVFDNPALIAEWHPNKNPIDPHEITEGSNRKVWWQCEKNHEWEARVADRSQGKGCPYCAGRKVNNKIH